MKESIGILTTEHSTILEPQNPLIDGLELLENICISKFRGSKFAKY